MTSLRFAPQDARGAAIPLHLVRAEGVEDWTAGLDPAARAWVGAMGFTGEAGSVLALPDAEGGIAMAVAGLGNAKSRRRGRFGLAAARARLPGGTYALAGGGDGIDLDEAALGWLLAGYRFGRYAEAPAPRAELVAPEGVDAPRLEAIAAGEALTRDLINTPSSDMGPAELEAAVRDLARAHRGRGRGDRGRGAAGGEPAADPCGRAGEPAGAAADRPALGRERAAGDAGGQGGLLRHRRAEPQAGRVDGADEEGHGRGGDGAGPRADDHGAGAGACGCGC